MRSRRHASRGYSLSELLTVIAIIAIASLVTIPQFITYQRNGLIKSSMRNFVNDVRYARQYAVSKHDITRISFDTGTTSRNYVISRWNSTTSTWQTVRGNQQLERSVYFDSTTFTDLDSDGQKDIVFDPNGTVRVGSGFSADVVIRTAWKLAIPAYTVHISAAGFVKADKAS